MNNRPPLSKRQAILIYCAIALFALLMITGASFAAMAVFVLLAHGFNAAIPYFLLGLGLIALGYFINVGITYYLTKELDWRIFKKR